MQGRYGLEEQKQVEYVPEKHEQIEGEEDDLHDHVFMEGLQDDGDEENESARVSINGKVIRGSSK